MADDGFQLTDIRIPIFGDIWDQLTGQTYQTERITGEEADRLYRALRDAGVEQDEIDREFAPLIADESVDVSVVRDYVDDRIEQARTESTTAEADAIDEEARAAAIERLDALEAPLRQRFGELGAIIENPSAVRSDYEFGRILGEAENAIAADLDEELRSIGAATAGSGLRSSGGGASAAVNARRSAGNRRSSAFAETLGGARDARRGLLTPLSQIGDQRFNIDQGRVPTLLELDSINTSARSPFSFTENVLGPRFAVEEARRGVQGATGTGILGSTQQAIDDGFNYIDEFIGGD